MIFINNKERIDHDEMRSAHDNIKKGRILTILPLKK
jgi:hypothetical protein